MGVHVSPSLESPTICVCVDASSASRQAAQWATTLLPRGANMKLMTVTQPTIGMQLLHATATGLPVNLPCEADPRDVDRAEAVLRERTQDVAEMGVEPSRVQTAAITSCTGTAQDIADRLMEEAEKTGCSCIVIGSRGLGVSERAVLGLLGLGSVSERIVKISRVECVAVHRPFATAEWVTPAGDE